MLLGTQLQKNMRKIDVVISFLTTAHHQAPRSPIAIMAGGAPPPPHPPPPHKTLLLLRSLLPRAKKHSFSAKSNTRALKTQSSVGLRRSKRGSTKFNTFAESVFLRLSRSCRVAEKSDPIDRFSGPDLQKITKNRWFLSAFSTHRITKYLAVR